MKLQFERIFGMLVAIMLVYVTIHRAVDGRWFAALCSLVIALILVWLVLDD